MKTTSYHVYAEDGFESAHLSEQAAIRAAKRGSRARGLEYRVIAPDIYGQSGSGRGTVVALVRGGAVVAE